MIYVKDDVCSLVFSTVLFYVGRMSFVAYSSNVFDVFGATVFTSDEPSTMKTSDSGFDSGSLTFAWRTSTKSALVHVRRLPFLLSEEG